MSQLKRWLVDRLLPNCETSFLSGSSGAGKTTWLRWFLSQLQEGTVFGRVAHAPSFVAYIEADRAITDSLEKLGRIPYYSLVDDSGAREIIEGLGQDRSAPDRLLQRAFDHLSNRYLRGKALPPGALIIVDGMGAVLGIEPAGSYLRDVARPLILANELARRQQLTLLLVHHGVKVKADTRYLKPEDNILGSMALQGYSSSIFHLTEPELTRRPSAGVYELTVRSHSAAKSLHLFKRGADGHFTYVGEGNPYADDEKTSPLREAVLMLVPKDGTVETGELVRICQQAGVSRASVYRILGELQEEGMIQWDKKTKTVERRPVS